MADPKNSVPAEPKPSTVPPSAVKYEVPTEFHLFTENWKTAEAWLWRSLKFKILGFVGLTATALSADIIRAWYIEKRRIPRMVEAFERGSVGVKVAGNYFARTDLEQRLAGLIAPESSASFNLVCGEPGCGKSTLVEKVCHGLGSGTVLCVLKSDFPDLFGSLCNALDYDVRPSGGLFSQISSRILGRHLPDRDWDLFSQDVRLASAAYRSKHMHQPALVIDNINALVKKCPAQFDVLIGLAKDEASMRGMVITMVASEGNTLRRLEGLSESSRLRSVFEVGDLSDEEAQKFFLNKLPSAEQEASKEEAAKKEKANEEIAKEVVAFVGGRMQLLVSAGDDLNAGNSPSSIKDDFISKANAQLVKERIELPKNPAKLTERHVEAWNAIIEIIDSPNHEIPRPSFTSSVGADLGEDLMTGNVFAFHPSRISVGLQSRPMDIYLSQIVGSPNSVSREALLSLLKHSPSKL